MGPKGKKLFDIDPKLLRVVGVMSTVGIALVVATFIGVFIGLQLDAWLGTSPWMTIVFTIIGIIAGFRNLFIYSRRGQQRLEDEERKEP